MEDYKYYFHNPSPFSINDEVAWNRFGKYKKAIIVSEQYIAPSGCPHTNIKVKDLIYAVPTYDLKNINDVKIINEAFIFCSNKSKGLNYSRRSFYNLWFDGEIINETIKPYFRKEANTVLLDESILKKYNIHKVYSRGILIYNKE